MSRKSSVQTTGMDIGDLCSTDLQAPTLPEGSGSRDVTAADTYHSSFAGTRRLDASLLLICPFAITMGVESDRSGRAFLVAASMRGEEGGGAAQQARRLLIDDVATTMAGVDALLAPATPVAAPPRDASAVVAGGQSRDVTAALLSGVLAISELGWPALSIPIGSDEACR